MFQSSLVTRENFYNTLKLNLGRIIVSTRHDEQVIFTKNITTTHRVKHPPTSCDKFFLYVSSCCFWVPDLDLHRFTMTILTHTCMFIFSWYQTMIGRILTSNLKHCPWNKWKFICNFGKVSSLCQRMNNIWIVNSFKAVVFSRRVLQHGKFAILPFSSRIWTKLNSQVGNKEGEVAGNFYFFGHSTLLFNK